MSDPAADLARRLARDAEALCRRYLPGRTLYVRLHGPDSGPGAARKWTDAGSSFACQRTSTNHPDRSYSARRISVWAVRVIFSC
jgi:hypothetical protein